MSLKTSTCAATCWDAKDVGQISPEHRLLAAHSAQQAARSAPTAGGASAGLSCRFHAEGERGSSVQELGLGIISYTKMRVTTLLWTRHLSGLITHVSEHMLLR